MAIDINQENFPLIVITFTGTSNSEEMQLYLDHLNTWLEQNVFFGLVVNKIGAEPVDNHAEDPKNAKDTHQLVTRWAKQHKLKMEQYCVGMAVIDSTIPISQQKLSSKAIGLVFGCPGQWFESIDDASIWINQQLNLKTQA